MSQVHERQSDRGISVVPPPAWSAALIAEAFARHQPELLAHAGRFTHDREAAADVVQDAFVRLVGEVRKGTVPTNMRAWLYRVTTNAAISRTRRVRVAEAHATRAAQVDAPEGPEARYLAREHDDEIQELLESVSADERRALLLAAHGVPGEAIGAALGRSHVATRALMCRARGRLRRRLAEGAAASA